MSVEDAEKYWPVQAWSEVEQIEDGMRFDFRRMEGGITTNNTITVNTPAGKEISLYVFEVSAGVITVRANSGIHAGNHYRLVHEDGHFWYLKMERHHIEALARRAPLPPGNSGK